MKEILIIMAMAICLGAGAAQDKGTQEKNVPVTQFDKVSIAGSFTVRFAQGRKHKCTIIASPEDMEKLKAEVKDNQLNIYVESEKKGDVKVNDIVFSTVKLSGEVIVNVTSPELNKVDCMGSGDFIATTDIKADNITFNIAGSGNIILKKVTADKLHLSIAGSGDIDLEQAKAERTNVSIAGSGDIDLQQTNAKKLDVSIAGSGDIKLKEVDDGCEYAYLWVAGSGDIEAMFSNCQELKCNVAGSGEIGLKGNVVNYSSTIAGSGEIKKENLVISGNCKESNTNQLLHYPKRPRTVNNINAEP